MLLRFVLWIGLLLYASAAQAQIVQFSGANAPGNSPVVASATFSPSTPASSGGAVGTITATNSPTSWSITAGNSSGDFTISNSGVLTFTSQGQTDWNASSNLKTATLTVEACNNGGGNCGSNSNIVVNGYADGSVNAPSCTIQQPSLLSSYTAPPPWKVAGVNYCVGVPSSVSLTNAVTGGTLASGLTSLGCSLTAASYLITCSGSDLTGQTISGWNFADYGLLLQSASNVTVTQNQFTCDQNSLQAPIHVATSIDNLTISQNNINGAGWPCGNVGVGLIEDNGYGNVTIEYNYITNAQAELLVLGNSSAGNTNLVVQYNLGINGGLGQPAFSLTGSISGTTLDVTSFASGSLYVGASISCSGCSTLSGSPITVVTACPAGGCSATGDYSVLPSQTVSSQTMTDAGYHGDWNQSVWGNTNGVITFTYQFNTFLQEFVATGVGSQGITLNGNSGQVAYDGASFLYNTVIAQSDASMNNFFNPDYSWNTGTGTINYNYIDPTGMSPLSDWADVVNGTGGNSNTYTAAGNINMTNGNTLTCSSCE